MATASFADPIGTTLTINEGAAAVAYLHLEEVRGDMESFSRHPSGSVLRRFGMSGAIFSGESATAE